MFLLYTERSVRSDDVCKTMKRQLVAHLYHPTMFLLWFLQYVFLWETDPAIDEKIWHSMLAPPEKYWSMNRKFYQVNQESTKITLSNHCVWLSIGK